MSKLACEQKKKKKIQVRRKRKMAEKETFENKINVKNDCLVFFKWMAFSPFHPPSSELRRHGSCMI